jgi:hypothetical protein
MAAKETELTSVSVTKTISDYANKNDLASLVARGIAEESEMPLKELLGVGGPAGFAASLAVVLAEGMPVEDASTAAMYEERRRKYGMNELPKKPLTGFIVFAWEAFQDPTLLVLVVCGIISLILGLGVEKDWAMGWVEGVAIGLAVTVVVAVSAGVNTMNEQRADSLKAKNNNPLVKCMRGGEVSAGRKDELDSKPAIYKASLVVGDIVYLEYGAIVPADGIVFSADDLQISEASLTGESDLKVKVPGKHPFVVAGTDVMKGAGKMLVMAVGSSTKMGKINAAILGGLEWNEIEGVLDIQAGENKFRFKPDEAFQKKCGCCGENFNLEAPKGWNKQGLNDAIVPITEFTPNKEKVQRRKVKVGLEVFDLEFIPDVASADGWYEGVIIDAGETYMGIPTAPGLTFQQLIVDHPDLLAEIREGRTFLEAEVEETPCFAGWVEEELGFDIKGGDGEEEDDSPQTIETERLYKAQVAVRSLIDRLTAIPAASEHGGALLSEAKRCDAAIDEAVEKSKQIDVAPAKEHAEMIGEHLDAVDRARVVLDNMLGSYIKLLVASPEEEMMTPLKETLETLMKQISAFGFVAAFIAERRVGSVVSTCVCVGQ